MIRKLTLFIAFVMTVCAVKAQAVGEWKMWSPFSGINDIVETPTKVYYTSYYRLYSYDKESNETYSYTPQNKLNDLNVMLLEYNPDQNYVLVAYDTGNIDLLFDNGRVVNLSDIKDANVPYSRAINNVVFGNDRIYVATDFGFVVYDAKKFEVVESGIFGEKVISVLPVGDFLLIAQPEKAFSYAPLNGFHNTLDKFTPVDGLPVPSWASFVDDKLVVLPSWNNGQVVIYQIVNDNGQVKANYKNEATIPTSRLKKTGNHNYFVSANQLVFINEDASREVVTLPDALKGQNIALLKGISSVWGGDSNGIANYSIGEDGSVTLLQDKAKPESISTDFVTFIRFDTWGNVWTGNLGPTLYRNNFGLDSDYYFLPQATTRIKNGRPEDVTPLVPNPYHNQTKANQREANIKKMFSCGAFIPDPELPNRYYQGYNMDGLFIFDYNEDTDTWDEVGRYTMSNSPFIGYGAGWGSRVLDVKFDKEGNLWVGLWADNTKVFNAEFYVLPKSVLRSKDPDKYEYDDWIPSGHQKYGFTGEKDQAFLITEKSNVLFSINGGWMSPMEVSKLQNTLADTSDDETFQLINPVDQDGITWVPTHITSLIEDKRGRVWASSSDMGIIEITDPANITPSTRIKRLKVPRNDGTDYADYLCGSDMIFGMAVDHSNRKWIATETSGVYLVSEDGDEIIEHFTTENSPLPTNRIISVACDPNTNMVYFGMNGGMVTYNSDSSPSAENYSEVYAYPNPVRPDYTGYITITGLMDNSVVKITDVTGNIIFQTRSEGGTAIWDGMDASHNRVKTGVYYVFASQNPDGSNQGAVTKIMIVR